MRVLVFPSCNEPGLEVLDALRLHPRVEVHGAASVPASIDPSVALLRTRRHALPTISDPGFHPALRALCRDLSIEFLFATVDAVVYTLASAPIRDVVLVGPSAEHARWALSKSAVAASVSGLVPTPRPPTGLPAFAKPDVGSGSRGARRLESPASLDAARAHGDLVQEWLPGPEYTVDCASGPGGRLIGHSVRRRDDFATGIARATTCVEDPVLSAHVAAIAARVGMAGPWFAQFREDDAGVARLMEVNLRVGGSSGASRLAGLNVPLLCLLAFAGHDVAAPRRMNAVTVTRRLDRTGDVGDYDDVIWDLDDTLLHLGDRVDPDLVGWLFRFAQAGKRQWLVSRNADPVAAVARARIPNLFREIVRAGDKVSAVRGLVADAGINTHRCVMINDSYSERRAFEEAIPPIRTIAPDAIGVLAV